MHPNDVGLWIQAGRRAVADGDVDGARSLFMRGCRFCTSSEELWVEYARVEMEWLAKMERKHKAPGNKGPDGSMAVQHEEDVLMFDDSEDEDEFGQGGDGDVILPEEPRQGNKAAKVFEEEAIRNLDKSPALEGAIPKTIFDVARKQPFWGAEAGESFFDMLAAFTTVSAQPALLQRVLDAMVDEFPSHPSTCSCLIRQPLVGVHVATVEFPKALREVLARIKAQMETTKDKGKLGAKTLAWIDPILARDDLDDSLRTVLQHTKRKLENP